MKKTDKISYQQKPKEELIKLLTEAQKKLVETKAKLMTGNQKDSSVFKKVKYEVALISTLLNQNDRK